MATKTTKRTTTTRKTTAKKPAASTASKAASVLNAGTETSYKTKYHVMCISTIIFMVISVALFLVLCNKQSDYEDDLNCVATDPNCTLPNKRADESEKENGDTSYYDATTVEQNAVSAAGQE